MQTPVIAFSDAILGYSKNPVLSELNLLVPPEAFLYLSGKTGSGKSTLLKTLYGQLRPLEGKAQVLGMDLHQLDRHSIPRLRRKLGIIFQDFNLLDDRSAGANLDFVLRATDWKKKKLRKQRIQEVLEQVGLADKHDRMPYQLSGGEQQRLVIARALLNKPDLILADEPTGNLDEETAQEIMELILRIKSQNQATLIMATHNRLIMERYPAQKLFCEEGRLIVEQAAFSSGGG